MDEKDKKVSFFAKNPTECPICQNQFLKEEMLTGRGRLIAGQLTQELRRLYEKNPKFGKVWPMAYTVMVCNQCLFAAWEKDFVSIKEANRELIENDGERRQQHISKIFGYLDFSEPRGAITGAASYVLAIDCYEKREKAVAPTFKMAISSLRAAWLFGDIAEETEKPVYRKIQDYYYLKAMDKYFSTLERMSTADKSLQEPIDAIGNFGPDTDQNYGYESILYLCGYLQFKMRDQITDKAELKERLEKVKIYISKVFGTGRASKGKPSVLIDKTKDLYDEIAAYIKNELEG